MPFFYSGFLHWLSSFSISTSILISFPFRHPLFCRVLIGFVLFYYVFFFLQFPASLLILILCALLLSFPLSLPVLLKFLHFTPLLWMLFPGVFLPQAPVGLHSLHHLHLLFLLFTQSMVSTNSSTGSQYLLFPKSHLAHA